MRAVFGMLLIGGGVILMYGLFSGSIQFPLSPGITTTLQETAPAAGAALNQFQTPQTGGPNAPGQPGATGVG